MSKHTEATPTNSLTVLADRLHEAWQQRSDKHTALVQAKVELEQAKQDYWDAAAALLTFAEGSADSDKEQ